MYGRQVPGVRLSDRQHFQTTSPLKPIVFMLLRYHLQARVRIIEPWLLWQRLLPIDLKCKNKNEKLKLGIFVLSSWRYLNYFVLQKCLFLSPVCFI